MVRTRQWPIYFKNIFANPTIRYLIMWGADMSQSGHALLRFMQKGIDENYQIVDARGEIEKEIPGTLRLDL